MRSPSALVIAIPHTQIGAHDPFNKRRTGSLNHRYKRRAILGGIAYLITVFGEERAAITAKALVPVVPPTNLLCCISMTRHSAAADTTRLCQ